jgi:hypothetical protein
VVAPPAGQGGTVVRLVTGSGGDEAHRVRKGGVAGGGGSRVGGVAAGSRWPGRWWEEAAAVEGRRHWR